jgi:hypothetical protein
VVAGRYDSLTYRDVAAPKFTCFFVREKEVDVIFRVWRRPKYVKKSERSANSKCAEWREEQACSSTSTSIHPSSSRRATVFRFRPTGPVEALFNLLDGWIVSKKNLSFFFSFFFMFCCCHAADATVPFLHQF